MTSNAVCYTSALQIRRVQGHVSKVTSRTFQEKEAAYGEDIWVICLIPVGKGFSSSDARDSSVTSAQHDPMAAIEEIARIVRIQLSSSPAFIGRKVGRRPFPATTVRRAGDSAVT